MASSHAPAEHHTQPGATPRAAHDPNRATLNPGPDGPTTATKPRSVPLPESPLSKLPVMNVKARLGATKFVTDAHEHQHITVDPDICQTCPHTMCVTACPARCFEFVNGRMQFTYEDCVECGTCDIVCTPGSVKWHHPRASFGVNYRYG